MNSTAYDAEEKNFFLDLWNFRTRPVKTSFKDGCCVFWPANGCLVHLLLVEIIFFSILTSFSVTNEKKRRESAEKEEEMLAIWQTQIKSCNKISDKRKTNLYEPMELLWQNSS